MISGDLACFGAGRCDPAFLSSFVQRSFGACSVCLDLDGWSVDGSVLLWMALS